MLDGLSNKDKSICSRMLLIQYSKHEVMRPNVENDSGSLTKEMIVTNGCLCEIYIDVICELIWFYCKKWLHLFRYVLRNDVFIYKLICTKICDLEKMIYQRVLWKGFHKISLSLLDLRFKIPSFRIKCLGQVEKNIIEGLVASWESYQTFKFFINVIYFGQGVVFVCSCTKLLLLNKSLSWLQLRYVHLYRLVV